MRVRSCPVTPWGLAQQQGAAAGRIALDLVLFSCAGSTSRMFLAPGLPVVIFCWGLPRLPRHAADERASVAAMFTSPGPYVSVEWSARMRRPREQFSARKLRRPLNTAALASFSEPSRCLVFVDGGERCAASSAWICECGQLRLPSCECGQLRLPSRVLAALYTFESSPPSCAPLR